MSGGEPVVPSVPLSKFVEFTIAQGTSRVRIVADSKKKYEPQRDFYKRLREITQRQFIEGWNGAAYKEAIKKAATSKKLNSYEACRKGVTKWAGGKRLSASKGGSKIWSAGGLDVRVNPELDLSVNGEDFSTKLHFALDEPSGPRLETLFFLLSAKAPKGRSPAVLDLRRGRLITMPELDPNLGPLLRSDAAAFAALYS
jgi:hypothetical protein